MSDLFDYDLVFLVWVILIVIVFVDVVLVE